MTHRWITKAVMALSVVLGSKFAQLEAKMHATLTNYLTDRVAEFDTISSERRETLERLAAYVGERGENGDPVRLTFVCTHNSRRSQLSQVWAAAAAAYYDVAGIETFSGGMEATAFNPRAVSALVGAGWRIHKKTNGANPEYEASYDVQAPPLLCFSKVFSKKPNPSKGFAAVMTCSDADRSCPNVPGADFRLAITYEDPKISDGTLEEEATYDQRCQQIAREMLYVFSRMK